MSRINLIVVENEINNQPVQTDTSEDYRIYIIVFLVISVTLSTVKFLVALVGVPLASEPISLSVRAGVAVVYELILGIGFFFCYCKDNKLFFSPQPHASWSKNTTTAGWDAPITYPTVENYTEEDSSTQRYNIYWDEAAYQANNAKGWEATRPASSDTSKVYEWNSSSKSWAAQ